MKKFKFVTAMVLSAALSGNVLADLNDGLVAYYPFNGNAKDESGNENDGTVHGATLTEDRFGNSDSAYSFITTGNYISILHNPNVFGTLESFSISTWIKANSDRYMGGILSARHDNENDYNQGNFVFHTRLESIGFEAEDLFSGNNFNAGINIANGAWHHAVVVVEYNDKVQLFLDGRLKDEKLSIKAVTFSDQNNILIGERFCHGSRNCGSTFDGSIDDIRIYNRALSESEIQQLYVTPAIEEKPEEKPEVEISSKAEYDSTKKTLILEGVLVPFIDEFTGETTDTQGIFDVQLQEKTKLVFELISWSINFKEMFEGEDTSGYIVYDPETRSVDIPCFKVSTIAQFGDGIEGKAIYYKDVTMKQRHINYPIFHVEDMTETDSCK